MKQRVIIIISLSLLLGACTANTKNKADTLSLLQNDFNQRPYSAYVSANLKPQGKSRTASRQASKQAKQQTAQLQRVKYQLAGKQKQAAASINSVIKHNGLFKPKQGISEHALAKHAPLATVLSYAINNNLDIKTRLQDAKTNLAKYDQVGFLDDMLAQYSSFTNDLSLSGSTQKHKQAVSRGFPFPGLLSLKGSIIDQAVNTSRLQLKQTLQDVITQTRIAYYGLQFSQQETRISQQNIKLLKALKDELKSSYTSNDSGKSAELSGILQTDIEIEKNRNILQISKINQQSGQVKLNALLNLPSDFRLGKLQALTPVKLSTNTRMLINIARKNRVEITRLQSELKKMADIIQLSQKRFYPDFDAGYSRFNSRGSKPGFSQKPKFKNTINNGYFARNDAYLAETKQKYKALQTKIAALQTSTENELQQVLLSYNKEKSKHTLFQNTILPKAKATLDIDKNLYETGESSFLDILDAQEMILKYRLLSLKAIKGMNINAAKLDRLLGITIK